MFYQKNRQYRFDASVKPQKKKTLSESGPIRVLSAGSVLTVLGDGRLAIGHHDTIKVWDVEGGQCVLTLSGHTSGILALTVLRDGRLASASYDYTIKVWEVEEGNCVLTLSGHPLFASALTVLGDGRLVSGAHDIRIWDVEEGKCVPILSNYPQFARALTVLGDGRLASAPDNTIKVWNVKEGKCVLTLSGHTSWAWIYALTILKDDRLASASHDHTIKVWEVEEGRCELTLSGHTREVVALTVLGDGRLASGSWDSTIKVWDVSDLSGIERRSTGMCLFTISILGVVTSLTLLPSGLLAAGLFGRGDIELYDVGCRPVWSWRDIQESSLLNPYHYRRVEEPTERSWTKAAINFFAYHLDGTVHWVHALRGIYKERAILSPVLKTRQSVYHTLSFDQYFVNLALIDDVDHVRKEQGLLDDLSEDDPSTWLALDRGELYDRLFQARRYFALESVFGPLDRGIPTGWVRMIGRAGTGKTTLIQYLAYRWSQKIPLWDNRFDAVFQVKLNILSSDRSWESMTQTDAKMDLVELIHASFAHPVDITRQHIANFLTSRADRALILLDGFDEIADRWHEPRIQALIQYALNHLPNGILTSRPRDWPAEWQLKNPFKQTIENIGLSEENVACYVEKYFSEQAETSASLLAALSENPAMMRLAQVPVNIDAICAVWQENTTQQLLTMTTLYHRVILSILCHAKLKENPAARPVECSESYLRRENATRLKQLAKLAYSAFENNQTQTLSAALLANFFQGQESELPVFRETWGVLRHITGETNQDGYTPHYFAHLTYQEYFTALHFAEALIPEDKDNESPLNKKIQHIHIQLLSHKIRKKRHEQRYAVIWTFLAGLLSREPYHAYADYYWDVLLPEQAGPSQEATVGPHLDMVVLAHYSAIIREAILATRETQTSIPARLITVEQRLRAVLRWQSVYSDTVLTSLGDADTDNSLSLQQKWQYHQHKQRQIEHDLAQWGTDALPALPWQSLLAFQPPVISPPIASSLPHQPIDLRELQGPDGLWQIQALCYQPMVDSILLLQHIFEHDAREYMRSIALVALSLQQSFFKGNLDFLYSAITDPSDEVERGAAMMLGLLYSSQSKKQQEATVDALFQVLHDSSDAWVHVTAAKALMLICPEQSLYCLLASILASIAVNAASPTHVALEAIHFLKEHAARIHDKETVLLLLSPISRFVIAQERDILLRRLLPKTYELCDLDAMPDAVPFYIESLWWHLVSSPKTEKLYQQTQAVFFEKLSTAPELMEVVDELKQPLALPLQTNVLTEAFIDDIHVSVEMTIEMLVARILHLEGRSKENAQDVADLQQMLKRHEDLLSQVDQKIETAMTELRQDFSQELKEKMRELIDQLARNEKTFNGITDASSSQQAYMKRFQLIIIQTHLVALVGTGGTFSLNASNTASMMNVVCSIVGNFIPIAGGGASALLGYLIQSSDEDKTKHRLDRVAALGFPEEVKQIAAQLSKRSVSCLVSLRQVKRQGLQRLLGAFQKILHSLKSQGFYETMFAKMTGHLVTQEPSITYTNVEAEEYAESDAKLLLTAIAKEQVPMRDGVVDQDRLFLYLLPTLTSVDLLFLNILLKFCSGNDKKQDQVYYKQKERVTFCTNVAKSFHTEANLVAERLADNTDRESFINALAIAFSTKEHADNTRGLFYIKKNSWMMVFSRDQHISIQNAALAESTTQEVLQQVLEKR